MCTGWPCWRRASRSIGLCAYICLKTIVCASALFHVIEFQSAIFGPKQSTDHSMRLTLDTIQNLLPLGSNSPRSASTYTKQSHRVIITRAVVDLRVCVALGTWAPLTNTTLFTISFRLRRTGRAELSWPTRPETWRAIGIENWQPTSTQGVSQQKEMARKDMSMCVK